MSSHWLKIAGLSKSKASEVKSSRSASLLGLWHSVQYCSVSVEIVRIPGVSTAITVVVKNNNVLRIELRIKRGIA